MLDAILVDAARAAGAEVRENFSVQELLTEDGAVVGIRGQVSGGEPILERARIVIGADGRNSLVARSVAAESYNTIPPRQVGYYSYWSGFDNQNWSELHAENGQVRAFIFPTNDGLCCIGALTKYSEFETVRKDPAAFMRGTFLDIKSLAGRCENLKQEGRTMGWSGYESYYKKPFGPGWALVGDAGYLKDPTLGQGINDAFRDAEYLAGGLDAGFSGREELTAALAAYQQRRDAESGPVYAMNDLFASGQVSPMLMEMLIAGQQMLKAAG